MTSSYKFHQDVGEIVPFTARYSYPTQANKAWKSSVKIPPKNGTTWSSAQYGASMAIDLPAQGYLNTQNSYLSFDVSLDVTSGQETVAPCPHFQNNIHSVFNRMRLNYGSLSIEDIRNSNVLVRMLTEATGQSQNAGMDQNAISEGIGGINTVFSANANLTTPPNAAAQDSDVTAATNTSASDNSAAAPPATQYASVPWNARVYSIQTANVTGSQGVANRPGRPAFVRRYEIQLPFGIFQQNKLLPLKWMASQLSMMFDLAPVVDCIVQGSNRAEVATSYTLSNVFFNAELLEFDSSYDAAFLEGLRGGGVPIKFSSWNTYLNSPVPGSSQTIQIPERNRSIKALFTVMNPAPAAYYDSHAMLQSSGAARLLQSTFPTMPAQPPRPMLYKGHVRDFQYRIGGKYWPSTPVQCGEAASNGAAEAYIEFAKALNIVGDYRLHSGITPTRWSARVSTATDEYDYSLLNDWQGREAIPWDGNTEMVSQGPSMFVIAANLEATSGTEISGLNGEEQNDIQLNIHYSEPQSSEARYLTFVYYDALLVLRENNLVELIK